MGARGLFWCSLLASVALVGCGNQPDGDDGSVGISQLSGHVGSYCSGGAQSEQGFLYSREELHLGNELRLRVFGGMREPVRVRWQLCEIPSTGVSHALVGEQAKTGETAVNFWAEHIASGNRINISDVLNPGARLEIYSADRPDTVFVRVKPNNVRPKFLISLKNLDANQLRSVISISRADASMQGQVKVGDEVIDYIFGGGRLENKNYAGKPWKGIGEKVEDVGKNIAGNTLDIVSAGASAVGDIGVVFLDGMGDILNTVFGDILVPVVGLAADGIGFGVSELGNLMPGSGDDKKAGPSPLEQVCGAINPKLVEIERRFCSLMSSAEAGGEEKVNSQAMQLCQAYTEKVKQSLLERNKVTITFSPNYCVLYAHAVVQNCVTSTSPQETKEELLKACKTP